MHTTGNSRSPGRTDLPADVSALVGRYFDLLQTNDVDTFDAVFAPEAQLYGLKDDAVLVWPAAHYRAMLAARPSPQAQGAPREDEILASDLASDTQAFAKLAARIGDVRFIDYLTILKLPQGWRVVSKTYHRFA